jgi:hypothetical protein
MEKVLGAGFIALCVWITEQLLSHTDTPKQYRFIILCVVIILSFIFYNQMLQL